MKEPSKEQPIEVEVVRLPRAGEARPTSLGARLRKAVAPVLAGLFLDLVNFATATPVPGLILGAIAGWWVGGKLGLPLRWRVALTIASAAYCAIPGRRPLPVGTLLGALCRIDLEALRRTASR